MRMVYGRHMDCYATHGTHVDCIWSAYGYCVDSIWIEGGGAMAFALISYRLYTVSKRIAYGIQVVIRSIS